MEEKVKSEFKWFMSQFICGVAKKCEPSEDGGFIILVGDENYNHERLNMSSELFFAMWKEFT